MKLHRQSGRNQRGAALVEFAIVMPILFLLIFGIIEFGWAFYQLNDVRNGARETARLAAVNYKETSVTGPTQTQQIIDEICGRIEEGNIDISISLNGTAVGDSVTVEIERAYRPLTGFLTAIYNPASVDSSVEMRLEQAATFDDEPNDATFGDCP